MNLTLQEREKNLPFRRREPLAIPIPMVAIGAKERNRIMPQNHPIRIGYKLTKRRT